MNTLWPYNTSSPQKYNSTPLPNMKFLIHGVEYTTSVEDTKLYLQDNVKGVFDVFRLRKTNKLGQWIDILPIFVVCRHDVKLHHFNKIRVVNNLKVSFSVFKEHKTLLQWHNCQQLGHTKNHCLRKPRCVKCRLNHSTLQCNILPKQKKCANCGRGRGSFLSPAAQANVLAIYYFSLNTISIPLIQKTLNNTGISTILKHIAAFINRLPSVLEVDHAIYELQNVIIIEADPFNASQWTKTVSTNKDIGLNIFQTELEGS